MHAVLLFHYASPSQALRGSNVKKSKERKLSFKAEINLTTIENSAMPQYTLTVIICCQYVAELQLLMCFKLCISIV